MDNLKPEVKGLSLSKRLQAAATELHDLEQSIKGGDFDPRLLRDFREAVDYVRTTSWAVQEWVGLREGKGDPYGVLPILSAERVCRTTQLASDLILDLQTVEVGIETKGLPDLFVAIDNLHRFLAHSFKPKT